MFKFLSKSLSKETMCSHFLHTRDTAHTVVLNRVSTSVLAEVHGTPVCRGTPVDHCFNRTFISTLLQIMLYNGGGGVFVICVIRVGGWVILAYNMHDP